MFSDLEIEIDEEHEKYILHLAEGVLIWLDPASKSVLDCSSLESFEKTAGIAIVNHILVSAIRKGLENGDKLSDISKG